MNTDRNTSTPPALALPLSGRHLLEAAAGTGKTHAIKTLFARLILEKHLPVESILTVTYTEAAARELKDRIRNSLESLLTVLETGHPSDDPVENQLLAMLSTTAPDELRRRLRRALRDFDEAMIATIHGFCSRMLREFAFENRRLFEQKLTGDCRETLDGIVRDYWRIHFYHAGATAAAVLAAAGITPENMAGLIGKILEHPGVPLESPPLPPPDFTAVERYLTKLADQWRKDRNRILELLHESPVLSRAQKAYCPANITAYAGALDHAAKQQFWSRMALKALDAFSSNALLAGSKPSALAKGDRPPAHPFFDLAEEWKQELLRLRAALLLDCRKFVTEKLAESRERDGFITYTDLLTDLYEALDPATPDGASGAAAIRQRFRAALIDEFQDTDPVQYGIFDRLFAIGDFPLILVGDPKQAIYAFRGADIFTYDRARRETPNHWALDTNYRSEARLVAAVNELFGRPDFSPFASREVTYGPPIHPSGKPEAAGRILQINGQSDPRPLKLLFPNEKLVETLGRTQDGGYAFAEAITAAEISRLLNDPACQLGGRRIRPSDIAVLVSWNPHGIAIRNALARCGIPAIPRKTGNVFDSMEAENLLRLTAALDQWESARLVRAAMALDLFGEQAEALLRDETVSRYRERFRQAREEWRNSGFITAFYRLAAEFGIRERLVTLPGGERRLTNYLQLAELLHGYDRTRHAEFGEIVRFFRESRDAANEEDNEIRLESDRDAVTIITIHKSKGLQYPITFVPYLFCDLKKREELVRWHLPETGAPRLTVNPDESIRAAADAEAFSEKLRLLYVALTRAENRCYVLQYPVNRNQRNSLDYLFGPWPPVLPERPEHSAVEKIAIAALPKPASWQPEISDSPLVPPSIPSRVQSSWQMLSFTTLAGHADFPEYAAELLDYDDADEMPEVDRLSHTDVTDSDHLPPSEENIPQLFPPGAVTGNCWHQFFEEMDFRNATSKDLRELADTMLNRFGLTGESPQEQSERQKAMVSMAETVRNLTLLPGLRLADIPRQDTLRELRFLYPTGAAAPQQEELATLLNRYAGPDRPYQPGESFSSGIPPESIMTGAADLVFRCKGKFYLLDWKSNRLDDRYSSFLSRGLAEEMRRNHYCLQYLLYIVALNRHLARTMPDYRYERDFGGVFYVFLRGIRAGQPEYGIFRDVIPPPALVRELEQRIPEAQP